MKRFAAFLGALLLALSFGAAAQLAMTGAGKNPAGGGGGGGTVAFDSSVTFTEEDSTTPTSTDAWTIASTSNRWAIAAMLARDFGTPATHSGMTLEAVSMTQLGSTADIESDTSAFVSRWNLTAPGAGSSMTLVGTLSTTQAVGLISGAVFNGVNQTTPVSSTPTAVEGSYADDTTVDSADGLTITGTTATNGMLVAVISLRRSDTTAPTVTPGTGTTCIAVNAILESLYICYKADTAGSTTISPSFAVPTSSGTFRIDAYAVQP